MDDLFVRDSLRARSVLQCCREDGLVSMVKCSVFAVVRRSRHKASATVAISSSPLSDVCLEKMKLKLA